MKPALLASPGQRECQRCRRSQGAALPILCCLQELEGRRISVTRAVPQDQTKPGTPAAILGGGSGARREYAPRREYGGYGRDRGYGG
jgi:hypothetical protein